MRCLDENQILLVLEGEIPCSEVEEHLDACAACRRVLGAAAPDEDEGEAFARGAAVDRYVILAPLGRGSMSRVYKAYDPDLDRPVALKLLRREGDQHLILQEARALGKLSHPNVVQVYDAGNHEGSVFIAMELVDGAPLSTFCEGPPKPSFRAVIDAYIEAATGIGAAHARGIIHRDVKPSNILRGNDGRVRVADFGLAAIRSPASIGGRSRPARASEGLVGTPLYMAPEQLDGAEATPRSDQYGLCAALFEGLYGELPFPRSSYEELCAKKREGAPEAPKGTSVPAWIHRAIARGLAPESDDRHPSMEALIAALRDDPSARRRGRLRAIGAGAIGAALLTIAAVGGARSAKNDPCAHPERALRGAWDDDTKSRVRASLFNTKRSYAPDVADRVLARLDGYAAAWSAMRGEVCAASGGAGAPRESLAVRDACLDRRRDQLAALTALLAERPDPELLDKAPEMAAKLPSIATCADTEALLARVRPPEDPLVKARIAALTPRVDRAEALYKAGKFKDGLAIAEPLLAETSDLAYAPLRAQIEFVTAELRYGAGDYQGAVALLRVATITAAKGKDDILAVHAWSNLLFVTSSRLRRLDEAAVILSLGHSAAARVQDTQALSHWADVEGSALSDMGKLEASKQAYERGLAMREKALGPDHPDTSVSLNNLGIVLCRLGRCGEAKTYLERAVAVSERAIGPFHPDTAASITNLGNALRRTGDYVAARRAHERAIAIKEQALGPDHPSVAGALSNLGNVLHDMGDDAGALAAHERALAIKERALGPEHLDVASSLVGIGNASLGREKLPEAERAFERALALYEKHQGAKHEDLSSSLTGLGKVALARGDLTSAVRLLERAEKVGSGERRAEAQLFLAEALWRAGKERDRARSLAEQAREGFTAARHKSGLERAMKWLSAH